MARKRSPESGVFELDNFWNLGRERQVYLMYVSGQVQG
jgi:hypothetical protein